MTRKEYKAAHYRANADRYKEAARKSYAENREKRLLQAKAWAKANPDKVLAQNKKWAEKNKERVACIQIKAGLKRSSEGAWTTQQYDAEFLKQKGACAICGRLSSRRLDADHDHAEKKRRGLLCNSCNMMLGYSKDSPVVLEKAAAYLRAWGK